MPFLEQSGDIRLRQSLLAHRQARDDMVGQMRGGRHHVAGWCRRAHVATVAGVSDQEVVSAVGAAGTGVTVGKDAAAEVAAEFPLGRPRTQASVGPPQRYAANP